MREFLVTSPDRDATLKHAYEAERARLIALAAADTPQGDYLHPVFGEGKLTARVLFIGEAPGKEEAASGRPFVGKAGKQLDALLDSAGILREDVFITNAVKYRPVLRSARSVRNRTPGTKEVGVALPLLMREIACIRPRVIVTLGNTPLSAVLALFGPAVGEGKPTVGALHGRAAAIIRGDLQTELFPLYHPASGIYNRALVPVMEEDIHALGEHLVNLA